MWGGLFALHWSCSFINGVPLQIKNRAPTACVNALRGQSPYVSHGGKSTVRTFSIAQCFCLAFGVQGILICMEMPRQIITRIRSTRRKDGSILTCMHLRRMINRFGTFEMLSVRLWRGVFSCTLCRGERKSEPPPYMRGNAGSGKAKGSTLIL